ncbi:hypothetical protein K1719_008920 [Acacia pycnantha]|nr:hypothetical protein K1719_008920 [Acacia pycnantha]
MLPQEPGKFRSLTSIYTLHPISSLSIKLELVDSAFWFDTQKKLRGLTGFRLGFVLLGLLSPFVYRAIPAYQRTPEQPAAISRFRSSPLPSISCQNMEDEDSNKLPAVDDSVSENEKSKTQSGYSNIDSQPNNSERKEDMLSGESVEHKDYVDNHALMETEDTVSLPVSINTSCEHENKEKFSDAGTRPGDILDGDNEMENGKLGQTENFIQLDSAQCLPEAKLDKDLNDGQSTLHVNFELSETVMVSEEQKCSNSGSIAENGCQSPGDGTPSRSNYRSCILY